MMKFHREKNGNWRNVIGRKIGIDETSYGEKWELMRFHGDKNGNWQNFIGRKMGNDEIS